MIIRLKKKRGLTKPSKDRIVDLKKGIQYGSRNNSAFRLACNYKNKGITKEDIIQLLFSWNKKNKPPLPDNEIINCIKSAFSKEDLKISINQIIKEPVLNNQELKWLYVSDIFETYDPDLWQCKKCKTKIQSEKKPYFCSQCNRETDFEQVTESIDPNLWRLPRWEELPELDMQNTFIDIKQLAEQCIIFPEKMHYKILALVVIATWKTGCWDTVPFLIFRGLVESGKTRALEFLRELCYRAIHASGITQKAIFRFGDLYNANLLIDEIDNKIDYKTESGREMIDYLKPSYRKGSYYYAADREDPKKIQKYKNFGFKAFAGEKGGYDQAIFSRAIDFQMEQDYPEVTELKTIEWDMNNLRTILLNYRYKTDEPPDLSDDFPLKGRDREIYSCIIRTAMHIGEEYEDIINFVKETQQEKQEEAENTDEYQVLKVIRNYECQPTLDDAPEVLSYSDIAEQLGWEDQKRQKLGYIFKKKLILKTKRRNKGSVLLLNEKKNQRRLQNLYRRFKL